MESIVEIKISKIIAKEKRQRLIIFIAHILKNDLEFG